MRRLLTIQEDKILRQERSVLESLQVALTRLDGSDEDLTLLKDSLDQLEEMFLLVVVGEFNAGKSALINALMGDRFLTEGVIPTTSQLFLIRYGEEVSHSINQDDVAVVHLPVEWLREVNLVDTPGTNAVIRSHEQITEHFVPRSDLVLFVTSADRPFSESERAFLERIRRWGKKIVIVVNKMELIQSEEERGQVLAFVADNARQLVGSDPRIFPVSARLALESKQQERSNGTPLAAQEKWGRSQFGALEEYILARLDKQERVRLKLENPLGIALNLVDSYRRVIEDRQSLLKGDFQTLDTIDEQLDAYEADMRRDFQYQSDRVDNVLYEMAERGDKFFDDNLRVTRILELINSERLRGEFERRVLADTSRQIEQHVGELIDWMVDKDYRQWQGVIDYINQRASQHTNRMVGKVSSEFEFSRQTLLKSVGRSAREVVDSYDREAEASKLAQEVQRAIVQTAAVEAGALGLGALLVAVLQTTLLDVTGVLGAGAVAALGLYVLPYRRAKVKDGMRTHINDLRRRLDDAISHQFEEELAQSVQRIREAIAPYTRFVRVEREKLATLDETLSQARQQLRQLQQDVQGLE
ncbi:MAG: dynamin family protein [Caldilineaceae bacterium]|nr:dynamin family protein [Caldilineaceae bacterium]